MPSHTATVPVEEQWISIIQALDETPRAVGEPAIRTSVDWGQQVSLEVQVYDLDEIPTVPAGAWQRDIENTVSVEGDLHVETGIGRQAELPQVPSGDYAVATWVLGRAKNAVAVAAWEKTIPTGDAAEVVAPDCAERWIVQLQRRETPRSISF